MATEVLRPQDCLRGNKFYSGAFSPPKPYLNRRKNRPVQANQTTTFPKLKQTRSNAKLNRKSSSPPPSPPVQEGFRLLKRGETFQPDQTGSEPGPPGVKAQPEKKPQTGRDWPEHETPPTKPVRFLRKPEASPPVEKTQPEKKPQTDRVRPELETPPTKPIRVGLEGPIYAGPAFTSASPEPSALPVPGFLRSSSVGSTSDEASRTLRGLLKLDFQ